MKRYLLHLTPNALFFVTLSVGILKRGEFDFIFDGSFLALFITCHFLESFKLYFLALSALAMAVFYPIHLLEIIGLSLSSLISSISYRWMMDEQLKAEKNAHVINFYEKILEDNLKKMAVLEDQLKTLVMQQLPECMEHSEGFIHDNAQSYDESLDDLEDKIALRLDLKEKKERIPLRRLRRIVMKQTSFFEEGDQS